MANHKLKGQQLAHWRINTPVVWKGGEIARLASAEDRGKQEFEEEGVQCRVMPYREAYKRQLELEGFVGRITLPNGKVIGQVRSKRLPADPLITFESQAGAPDPKNCLCQEFPWAPESDRSLHHPHCQYYSFGKPASKGGLGGANPLTAPERPQANESLGPVVQKKVLAPIPSTVVDNLLSPSECVCKDFPWQEGMDRSGHHPSCIYFERWKTRNRRAVLIDLITKKVVREATQAEIEEGDRELNRQGSPIIKIGETLYAVSPMPTGSENGLVYPE